MKALVLNGPSLDLSEMIERVVPTPNKNEVKIRVKAIGLNPVDFKLAQDGLEGWSYPRTIGLDGAGVVEAVGEKVSRFRGGERVFFHSSFLDEGISAEYCITGEDILTIIPDSVSFELAASLPCPTFTAYQAVFLKLNINPGDFVFIQGGSGAVGSYAVQMAKLKKAVVIATCSEKNLEYVSDLGASLTLQYDDPRLVEKVMNFTGGHGVSSAIDTIGGEHTSVCFDLIKHFGEVVCVVGLPPTSQVPQFEKALSLHEIALGAIFLSNDSTVIKNLAVYGEVVLALLSAGQLKTKKLNIVPLHEVPIILKKMKTRQVTEKYVAVL